MPSPLASSGRSWLLAAALVLGAAGPGAMLAGGLPAAAAVVKEGDRAPEPKGAKDPGSTWFAMA